jgi:hypothetical protein
LSRTIKLDNKKIALDSTGNPVLIQDHEKLLQDFAILVHIPLGRHYFHTNLGTRIESLIGKPLNPDGIQSLLNNEIQEVARQLQVLQSIQTIYQPISYAEALKETKDVEITDIGVSFLSFKVVIVSQSGEERRVNEVV